MNKPPILSLRNITISFAKKILFENLHLNLFPNDRVCLIGKNGVGKSTLMNSIAGVFEFDSGERWVAPNSVLGYLTQSEKIRENVKVSDYIKEGIEIDERKEYLIDIVCENLKIDKERLTSELSGGQKRRVNLAKSLVIQPDILLLDEPTNHLDMESCDSLKEAIKSFEGALIMVSHDEGMLKEIANKLVVFDDDKTFTFEDSYEFFLKRKGWKDS